MKRSEKIFAPEDFIMQECLKSNNIFQHLFNIFEGFFCYDRIYTMTRHEKDLCTPRSLGGHVTQQLSLIQNRIREKSAR